MSIYNNRFSPNVPGCGSHGPDRGFGGDGDDEMELPDAPELANDLFNMGKAIFDMRKCSCDGCTKRVSIIEENYEIAELAIAFVKDAPSDVQLRALIEDWPVEKVQEALKSCQKAA